MNNVQLLSNMCLYFVVEIILMSISLSPQNNCVYLITSFSIISDNGF